MTRTLGGSMAVAELQPFLYGLIGDEFNGTSLSVLSALARRGIDPWEQAGDWSRLPTQTATRELASLISMLPAGPSVRPAPEAIAARLIALLPSPRAAGGAPQPSPAAAHHAQVFFQSALFALLGAWIIIGAFQSAAADKAAAPAATAAPTAPTAPTAHAEARQDR